MRGRLFVTLVALLGFMLMASAPLRAHAADQEGLSELDRVLFGETTYQPETDYTPRLLVYPASITKTVELGQPIPADTLQVTASTTQSAAYTVSTNASWLSVLPASGTARTIATNHSVSYNTSLMATETTYNANITFSAPSAINPTVVVPVTIQVTAGLRLTAPTGTGVVWTQGRTYNVSWNVGSTALSESYFQILKGSLVVYTEATHHLGTGPMTAAYKVPYTWDPGSDYTVKVTGTGPGGKILTATSAPFTVQEPPVWMESPNGGETYFIGQAVTIKWRLNSTAAQANAVNFYLYNKNDLSKVVAQFTGPYVANGMGAMTYTIPDVGVGGGQFLLKVSSMVAHTAGDVNFEDFSDNYFTITDPVRVTSPNTGSELWYIDSPVTITWKTDLVGASVNLGIWDVSKNPMVKVADLGAGSGGSKTITVPAVPYNRSRVYKIMATRVDRPACSDLSNNAFTIVWPNIKVKAPNGGETLFQGKEATISWINEYKRIIGDPGIAIKLTNGSTTWTLATIIPGVNGTSVYGFNSGKVQIPANAPVGSNYKLKIESILYPGVYYDWSDKTFSIHPQPVQVISPNGSSTEKFFLGRTIPVHWKTYVADAGSQVYVELWRGSGLNSGLVLSLGVDSSTAGDHTVNFTLPDWLWIGTDFRIRVVSYNNLALDDFSDGFFEITSSPINILSPKGGQEFLVGKKALFEWSVNLGELAGKNYVQCSLMQNGTKVKDLGTYNVMNTFGQPYMYGTYYWTIPSVPAGNYTFRVTSVDFPSFYDESPAPFTIHDPPVQVLNPLQGEVLRAGLGYKAHWKTYIPDGGTQVKLELWRPSGKVADLGTDTSSAGDRYFWFLVPNVEAHDDYFIRAYSVSNPSLYGDSPWGTVTVNKTSINKGFTIAAAPAKPQGLTATGAISQVNLDWIPNGEDSIVAYKVYRATSLNAAAATLIGATDHPAYTDSANLVKGMTYYYWVTAVNSYGQESAKSDPAWDNVGVVDLMMPDMRVAPGKLVYLHVYSPAVSGILGNRLDVTVNYNKAIFTPVRFELTPLTKPFGMATSTGGVYWDNGSIALNSGIVRISPKNPGIDLPLSGNGRLFDIVFQVKSGVALGDYIFSFSTNTALYGPGTPPVSLAVNLADTARVTVAAPAGAGLDAAYSMGDVNGNGKVDYTDVNVAMSLVSGTTPTAQQLLAGDVSGDGVLDLVDVQLIMLLAQGQSINAKPLAASSGLMIKASAPRAAGATTTYTLTLPSDAAGDTGDVVNIPVNVNMTKDLTGMTLVVNYDDSILQFTGAVTTSLTSGFPIMSDTTKAGQVTVNMIGTTPVQAPSGPITYLKFKIKGVPGSHSPLAIADGKLYKGTGGSVEMIPSVTSGLATTDGMVTVVKRFAIGARRWVLFE